MIRQYLSFFSLACILFAAGGCAAPAHTEAPSPPPAETAPSAETAPPVSDESERLYAKGAEAYSQYDYDAAIAFYDAALDADRGNYKALSGKGVAMAMRADAAGNKDEAAAAVETVRAALAIYPRYVPAYYDLAMACKINGQYDDAVAWFEKVIAADPENTWSYYGIASIYGDQGDAVNAAAYLRRAAALDKENVLAAAQTQSHFDKVRHTPEFQAVLSE